MRRHITHARYVDVPFDVVAAILADDAVAVLQDSSATAERETHAAHAHLHAHLGGAEVEREVRIAVGPFEPLGITRVRVPLRWEAERAPALFPVAEGTLDVQAMSLHPPVTEVGITAVYEPPLGPLGTLGDTLLGHRYAEEAVSRFVREVADRVAAEAARRAEPEDVRRRLRDGVIVVPDEPADLPR
ncbi:MAG: hypothetical protein ACLGIR_10415 [Actinomycetes bacterium]